MTLKDLKDFAYHAARKTVPVSSDPAVTFSAQDVDACFAQGLSELAGSVNLFLKNQHDIFQIIIENADEIVPNKVIDALGIFAEVKVIGENQKVVFKTGQSLGKMRAKKFLTQVGLSGVYESFRLDSETFEIKVGAIGGAISIDFDRLLVGADTMATLMEVITTGLIDAAFIQVQKALKAAATVAGVPAANRVIQNTFDGAKLFKLINTVKAYGGQGAGSGPGAVVFAPPEFIAEMGADAIVPVSASGNYGGVYHPDDIDRIHRTGYINLFRGTPVVEIPQSFVDTTNTTTWIDPQLAYVLPTGGEKVVKIVYEGATQIWSDTNRDRSIEVNISKKMGVGIQTYYNWGIYQNTGITATDYNPYPSI